MRTSLRRTPVSLREGFLAATALGILAFKGFTTITNSGSELTEPHKNVGRAILISIALCVVIYALVGFAVASNLSIDQIIETKNYSLAAAARPALGDLGLWFTVILASWRQRLAVLSPASLRCRACLPCLRKCVWSLIAISACLAASRNTLSFTR